MATNAQSEIRRADSARAQILEALLDPAARGPVLFSEQRISRGRAIELLKFRTLKGPVLEGLGPGPTHIKLLESDEYLTRAGRVLKPWYLDELPQLINIVRGDMFLIGTRPYPIEAYEDELERGITRKRDMPAGLVGPVQASKGGAHTVSSPTRRTGTPSSGSGPATSSRSTCGS